STGFTEERWPNAPDPAARIKVSAKKIEGGTRGGNKGMGKDGSSCADASVTPSPSGGQIFAFRRLSAWHGRLADEEGSVDSFDLFSRTGRSGTPLPHHHHWITGASPSWRSIAEGVASGTGVPPVKSD